MGRRDDRREKGGSMKPPPELWLMPATPVVSTAHVPLEDIPRLDADAEEETKPNGVMGKLDHGWLIHIGDDLDETQWPGYSAAFVALLRLVQSWGFEYLRLDSDGSTLSIPTLHPNNPSE